MNWNYVNKGPVYKDTIMAIMQPLFLKFCKKTSKMTTSRFKYVKFTTIYCKGFMP